ncbi:hypothetical protein [Micromonospora sp. SL4-19]|uniref:hypothetical protein n=1 Tax=Micromonospora sp. SL4-19 TaxID=3399129 RepID=UPI003A4DA180
MTTGSRRCQALVQVRAGMGTHVGHADRPVTVQRQVVTTWDNAGYIADAPEGGIVSRWRMLRLEVVRLVRQPWRLAVFAGAVVYATWLDDQIPEHGLGRVVLQLLLEVPVIVLAYAFMLLPPVRDNSTEQNANLERGGESAGRSSGE